jgi:hypothetical protein
LVAYTLDGWVEEWSDGVGFYDCRIADYRMLKGEKKS